jgi:hypothetical protein
MTEDDTSILSESLIWETAKSSRHFLMAAPGLLERIISPAILLAKTESRRLGEAAMKPSLSP